MAKDFFDQLGSLVDNANNTINGPPPPAARPSNFVPTTQANAALAPRPAESRGRVIEQIETTAGYYGPDIYAQLTYYSNFTPSEDSLSADFIPVTQVKPNAKMFVVGIIPPASNLRGNLLDRSGSVANVVGAPEDINTSGGKSAGGTLTPNRDGRVPGNGSLVDTQATPVTKAKFAEALLKVLPNCTKEQAGILYAQFAGECGEGNCYGYNLGNVKHGQGSSVNYQALSKVWEGVSPAAADSLIASGLWEMDPSADHQKAVGKGKVAIRCPPGKEKENPACFFNVYPDLDTAMASFVNAKADPKSRYAGAWPYVEAGDVDGYARALGKAGYYTASPDAYSKAMQVHYNNWLKSPAFDQAQQKAGVSTETASSGWQKDGAKNASTAKEEESKTADNDYRNKQDVLGNKFLAAQEAEIRETMAALETMKNTPPLRMLVNPASFKNSSEKIISDGNWTRNGPVIEHWGEAQDKIEASGRVAGFFAIDTNNPRADAAGEAPGLTRVARNFTAAYHNFLSLWLLYRNNANLLISGQQNNNDVRWKRLSMVGSIYIYYDDIMYIGSFDNFNVTESDDKPYSLEYNFSFTVRAAFLLDRPDRFLDQNGRIVNQTINTAGTGSSALPTDLTSIGGGPVPPPPGTNFSSEELAQRNAVAEGEALPPSPIPTTTENA